MEDNSRRLHFLWQIASGSLWTGFTKISCSAAGAGWTLFFNNGKYRNRSKQSKQQVSYPDDDEIATVHMHKFFISFLVFCAIALTIPLLHWSNFFRSAIFVFAFTPGLKPGAIDIEALQASLYFKIALKCTDVTICALIIFFWQCNFYFRFHSPG
jgi:hypothetical protein